MHSGKLLSTIGVLLVLAGLFLLFGGKLPWLGKLPGDLRIEKDNFSLYMPLTTCIVLSIVISLLLWLFRR